MHSFYQFTLCQFTAYCKTFKVNEHQALTFYKSLYKNRTILDSKIFKNLINLEFLLPRIINTQISADKTVKFLCEFSDGKKVETVLIPFYKRYTVCLSTQVGCAMNCAFCLTGTEGFSRNLTASEIVGQYLLAFDWLKKNESSFTSPNIVFMGQGEPLNNFDEVKKATQILIQKEGMHLGPRQITLSTVGVLTGLKRFHEFPRINLALSLHSPFDEVRSKLIPINQVFKISELLEVLKSLPRLKRQYITFEYLLMRDVTDRDVDAHELAKILKNQSAIINLIPFNPYPGSRYQRSLASRIENFKEILVSYRLPVMVRTTKGDAILAACGQLKSFPLLSLPTP